MDYLIPLSTNLESITITKWSISKVDIQFDNCHTFLKDHNNNLHYEIISILQYKLNLDRQTSCQFSLIQ